MDLVQGPVHSAVSGPVMVPGLLPSVSSSFAIRFERFTVLAECRDVSTVWSVQWQVQGLTSSRSSIEPTVGMHGENRLAIPLGNGT